MKKMLFFAAIALAALGSCTSDEFVGENNPNETNENYANAIVFGTGVKAVTRADKTGSDAATLLNNNFVFAGTKSDGTTTPTAYVFDQYTAKWVENTAHTTESNSNDWEYVGMKPAQTSSLKYEDPNNSGNYIYPTQTIKYWDYSTKQYDFAAYSLGAGTGSTPTYATASAINVGTKSYTLTGSADELKACYISDLVTAYNQNGVSDYGKVVQFKFRSLGTKIRLAFYETVPGYSVKNVMFYSKALANETQGSETTPSAIPTLFTETAVLPAGNGTMTITFPNTGFTKRPGGSQESTDYNKAHVAFAQESNSPAASTVTFEALANFADAEKRETSTDNPATGWIGRASNLATYAGGTSGSPAEGKYFTVLPYETGANLQLRIKYTLVSTDGSNETIDVDNATAVVPAELAKWSPNYAYTYIFKISDMTNGSTGVDGNNEIVTGLTPITLDAVVVDSEDGVQETITTVSEPSITTYMAGKIITNNDEYISGKPIYIIVNSGTQNVELTNKANLYTVTLAASTDQGDTPAASAAQNISEASIANAFINGTKDNNENPATWTVKDANKWKLTLTKSNDLSLVNVIAAADSPTGNEISIGTAKVGKFTHTGSTPTTYVFQYKVADAVSATPAAYTAVANGTTLTSGNKYYTSNNGDGEFQSAGTEVADGTNYFVLTTAAVAAKPAVYQYKIIKVVAALSSGD